MPLRQLAKAQWQPFLDRVSAALGAERVQVEVTGLGLGDQVEADWIPLVGLSYEPKGDVLTVAAEGIQHLIHHPRQVHVDHDMDWLHSIEAIDAEGNHHIITLRDALQLPAG
jgi:hypothetical protein